MYLRNVIGDALNGADDVLWVLVFDRETGTTYSTWSTLLTTGRFSTDVVSETVTGRRQ